MLESIAYLSLADTFLRRPPPSLCLSTCLIHRLLVPTCSYLPHSPLRHCFLLLMRGCLLVFTSIMRLLSAPYVIAPFLVDRTFLAACASPSSCFPSRFHLPLCGVSRYARINQIQSLCLTLSSILWRNGLRRPEGPRLSTTCDSTWSIHHERNSHLHSIYDALRIEAAGRSRIS